MKQTTSHVLMVRPGDFGFNPMTAESNAFQKRTTTTAHLHRPALAEFDALVAQLRANNLTVTVVADTDGHTPDSIFPNNWIATIGEAIYLFPMLAGNRRRERKREIIDRVVSLTGIDTVHDLTYFEKDGLFLEGTGSIVPDRVNKIAYACRSPRTHLAPLEEFCRLSGYRPVLFDAVDAHGAPIYHTNVMMALGNRFAAICLEAIPGRAERAAIEQVLADTGKEIVALRREQLAAFAGNMLELEDPDGVRVLVLSKRARKSLDPGQLEVLEAQAKVVSVPVNTIEDAGGGSVRCMIAELFEVEK